MQETFEASSSVFFPHLIPPSDSKLHNLRYLLRELKHTPQRLNKWRAASIVSLTRDFDLTLHYSAADPEM